MCYHGIGDTFTAAHKKCVHCLGTMLFKKKGYKLDHEIYVASTEQFAQAPFTVYVMHQKLAHLVLVPRPSCHQVVNHGGLSTKSSWSRMTMEGLLSAFHYELLIYRRYEPYQPPPSCVINIFCSPSPCSPFTGRANCTRS